jgi:dienelactone hydrolase
VISGEGADVRSRIHSYGGGAYAVAGDGAGTTVVWHDDRDCCLWRRELPAPGGPGSPEPAGAAALLNPLSHLPPAQRLCEPLAGRQLADGLIDRAGGRWIGVQELGERDALVSVPLAGGEPRLLRQAADFCGYAVLAPGGSQLAWLEWQRPAMPWQRSQLWLGRLTPAGDLVDCRPVGGADRGEAEAEGKAMAVFQPLWLPRPGRPADLVVACDRSGWWNLERLVGAEAAGSEWQPLLPLEAEFGMPQWVYGMATTGWDGRWLVAAACFEGRWQLGRLLPSSQGPSSNDPLGAELPLRWAPYPLPFDDLAAVAAGGGRLVAIAAGATTPAGLLELDTASGRWRHQPAAACPLAVEAISQPEPFWFAGHGGVRTQAWYYPPVGGPPAGGLSGGAPLLVKGHSGPTAMARTGFNLAIQYWTGRGWGVVDVNYGGSSGFGRAYRQRLDRQWGVVDVGDCAAAARALVAAGLADPARIAFEGGSAAGFTVLAGLCFTQVFRAGACRYAVADLEGMARHSHRFEEGYLESLVGPWPEAAATYRERSPLLQAERIEAPVIFFQGLEDGVVPPEQTERMAEALGRRGVPVEVHLFPGEGHGFRDSAVQQQVLEATEAFFRRHLQLPG